MGRFLEPLNVRRSDRTDTLPPKLVVRRLVEMFGPSLVAVIGRVKTTHTVRQWINGDTRPGEVSRLQLALAVTELILETEHDLSIIKAWMCGMNRRLGDRSPALVIATDTLRTARPDVIAAARSFLAESVY